MDAQFRHQITHTRAAVDAPSAPPEPQVPGPVCGVQETTARSAALIRRSPWWAIAAGALVGYELLRGRTRPAGSAPPPPPHAAVTPPGEPPSARARPTVYEAPWRWTPRARPARRWCSWTYTCPGNGWLAGRGAHVGAAAQTDHLSD
jgi:hypothetical protein